MNLTKEKIREHVKKYKLGEIYITIENGVHGDYNEKNKDKLAAIMWCKNTKVSVRSAVFEEFFDPLIADMEEVVQDNAHNGAGFDFDACGDGLMVGSVGFMAKGWPKLEALLDRLGIRWEFEESLGRGHFVFSYLTEKGAEILGVKPVVM